MAELQKVQQHRDQLVERIKENIQGVNTPLDTRFVDPNITLGISKQADARLFDQRKAMFERQLDQQFQMNYQHLANSRTIQYDNEQSKTLLH